MAAGCFCVVIIVFFNDSDACDGGDVRAIKPDFSCLPSPCAGKKKKKPKQKEREREEGPDAEPFTSPTTRLKRSQKGRDQLKLHLESVQTKEKQKNRN